MDRQEVVSKLKLLATKPRTANDYAGRYSVLFYPRDEIDQVLQEAAQRLEICEGCAYCFRLLQEKGIE